MKAEVHTLTGSGGTRVRIASVGATVMSLEVPDRDGKLGDVVLGHDTVEEYASGRPYFGAVVGRCANRISGARFELGGRGYRLTANEGRHHLHGGRRGFDKVEWAAEPLRGAGVAFSYRSRDGEEGYPGNVDVRVEYRLSQAAKLRIDYRATSDAPTPLNLSHHGYFNLAGHAAGNVLEHVVEIPADRFLPVDEELIPTGELRSVAGTPLDFRKAKPIGRDIETNHEQLRRTGGYDHCFELRGAVSVYEPGSGRALEIRSTEPGLQLYTGNQLDGVIGKDGARYGPRAGLCLEAQGFPNAPNELGFPSVILRPGSEYRQTTVYAFSCR